MFREQTSFGSTVLGNTYRAFTAFLEHLREEQTSPSFTIKFIYNNRTVQSFLKGWNVCYVAEGIIDIDIDIFVSCSWVDTRWQYTFNINNTYNIIIKNKTTRMTKKQHK
jgi:hypothetical protein